MWYLPLLTSQTWCYGELETVHSHHVLMKLEFTTNLISSKRSGRSGPWRVAMTAGSHLV